MTHPVLRMLAVPLTLLGGALIAVQSQLNGRLAADLGTGPRAGIAAAAISFGTGLVLVTAITALLPSARAGVRDLIAAARSGRLRPIEYLGGSLGATLVATQGLTVATIGVALFSVGVTAGQSACSLFVDHVGLGPSGRQQLSLPRVIAAIFAVAAVALAAGERLTEAFSWSTASLIVLPVVGGVAIAVQQALNGRLSAVGGAWATTFNNFVVGTMVLAVCLLLSLLAHGHFDSPPPEPWLYLGGAMGVVFIWLAAMLVKVHGVLVLGLSMIAGQVICAEILEFASGHAHVGALGVVAGALTVVGVLIALVMRPTPPVSHI